MLDTPAVFFLIPSCAGGTINPYSDLKGVAPRERRRSFFGWVRSYLFMFIEMHKIVNLLFWVVFSFHIADIP